MRCSEIKTLSVLRIWPSWNTLNKYVNYYSAEFASHQSSSAGAQQKVFKTVSNVYHSYTDMQIACNLCFTRHHILLYIIHTSHTYKRYVAEIVAQYCAISCLIIHSGHSAIRVFSHDIAS